MEFISLSENFIKENRVLEIFFKRIVYVVYCFYEDYESIKFLSTDEKLYESVYTDEFAERFPIVEDRHYYKEWTRYDIGYGAIFVNNKILKPYKKYADIDDSCSKHEPNFEAALKALKDWKI